MIKAKIEKVSISSITENAANPRTINKHKFQKLVNSVKEFPEMLSLRPIIVNKDNVILGGNMRYKACKELGLKEVYIIQAADLDDKQAQEFIVKDNVGFGEWDWSILANEWDNIKLGDWGMDVWQPEKEVDYSILEDIDLGSTLEDKTSAVKRGIVIEFEAENYDEANDLITQARKEGKNVGTIVLNAFRNEA